MPYFYYQADRRRIKDKATSCALPILKYPLKIGYITHKLSHITYLIEDNLLLHITAVSFVLRYP